MNCNNSVDVEFSTFVPVNSWMNVTEENMNDIKLCISVNTENLKVIRTQEDYGSSVEIQHPCGEGTITLDNVMIDVAKLSGYIGYVVGGAFLVTSDNVVIGKNNNDVCICNMATASDICHLDDVDFLVLDPNDLEPIELVVTVVEANVDGREENDSYDYQYRVSGKFRITRKSVTPVTPVTP